MKTYRKTYALHSYYLCTVAYFRKIIFLNPEGMKRQIRRINNIALVNTYKDDVY